MKKLITLNINGDSYELAVEAHHTLAQVIREQVRLTGTKIGCGEGDCGACTVLMDNQPVNSCLVLAIQAQGHEITTIEGLATTEELHPIQQAFVDHGAIQCGFCSPGMILCAKSILDSNPKASEEEIRKGLVGNLCRCTGYQKIVEAIMLAAVSYKPKRRKES